MARRTQRTAVSPAELLSLLSDAFERERPTDCDRCRVPLPYRIPRRDERLANWEIGRAAECPHRCESRIAAIVSRLGDEYDLEEPTFSHRHDEGRRLH